MARPKTHKVRIISGELKGRLLDYPGGRDTRPTMQQTKAAVFDSIGPALRGAVFVDLFAGAGAVGIEALSRGAGFVHFVEHSRSALTLLRQNLDKCRIGLDRARIHPVNVFDFLTRSGELVAGASLVFADPPYDGQDPRILLPILSGIQYAGPCLLVLEHRKDLPIETGPGLERTGIKKFGGTWVSFFVPAEGEIRS
jgi:16S rRNA (guanine966-N2)-methyltransferase